jgi:hypothetical protein
MQNSIVAVNSNIAKHDAVVQMRGRGIGRLGFDAVGSGRCSIIVPIVPQQAGGDEPGNHELAVEPAPETNQGDQ